MHQSSGPLRYSRLDDGDFKLVVEVDSGIVEVARALVPKSIRLNKPRYAPHISVVRKAIPPNEKLWGKYEGELIAFEYDSFIFNDELYYWLRCYSERLIEIRLELGFEPLSWACRPPDNTDCFHCTIGNTKP